MIRELTGLNNYITYINDRLRYLKIVEDAVSSNEYKFYNALRERIKQWGDTHALCYGNIRGKIDMPHVYRAIGVSERVAYRMMDKQRKELIKFITLQEQILVEQYPHFTEVNDEE